MLLCAGGGFSLSFWFVSRAKMFSEICKSDMQDMLFVFKLNGLVVVVFKEVLKY